MFLFSAGLQHPLQENQGSCTRVYISTSQSLDNNPTQHCGSLGTAETQFNLHRTYGWADKELSPGTHTRIHYLYSVRSSCQVYLNHSRSPNHKARASVQLYNSPNFPYLTLHRGRSRPTIAL